MKLWMVEWTTDTGETSRQVFDRKYAEASARGTASYFQTQEHVFHIRIYVIDDDCVVDEYHKEGVQDEEGS